MKTKTLLLLTLFISISTGSAFSQIDCSTSKKLVCQLPITSSILSADTSVPSQSAVAKAETSAGSSINASFATQLSQLPIPSATVGAVSLRSKGNQFGDPFYNLGPILTDRPDTVGKRHLFAGFSYQHFNFNAIDGHKLSDLTVAYTGSVNPDSGDPLVLYGSVTTNIAFKLDQYVALFTYGATRSTDITFVVPINNVSLDVTAKDFNTFLYDLKSKQYTSVGFPAGSTSKSSGTASGIGDIEINVKQLIYGAEGSDAVASPAAVAVGGTVRIPSGDDLNYLGSGAWGGNVYGLVSYRAKLSPHMKISYQWNGGSKLLSGSASGTSDTLPGGLSFDAGADYRLSQKFTVATDILGSQFINSPSLTTQKISLTPQPTDGTTPTSLTGVVSSSNTYSSSSLSVGLKWAPGKHFLLYGSVLLPLNNVGLRSDPVPLFGIAHNFKIGK